LKLQLQAACKLRVGNLTWSNLGEVALIAPGC
jgi:hypothetical protein